MLYKQDSLDVIVNQVRLLGEQLVRYNTPKNEDDIGILKIREIVVDGYEICVYYTKSKFESHCTEIVQIWGRHVPFLPFSVICKLAKSFLGNYHLALVELFKNNRKVYCWSVNVTHDGKPVRSPYNSEVEQCTFEGFNYSYMQPNQVNFY